MLIHCEKFLFLNIWKLYTYLVTGQQRMSELMKLFLFKPLLYIPSSAYIYNELLFHFKV